MNIAILLSGFPRNYANAFPFFKKHVLDTLQPDLFFYGYNQKIGEIDNQFLDTFQFKDYFLWDYTKETHDEIDKLYDWKPERVAHGASFEGFKSYSYNCYKCNELKNKFSERENKHYDIVIKTRPEWFYFRDLTLEEILSYPTDSITIPYGATTPYKFTMIHPDSKTDGFAIGNKKNMDIYADAWKYFKKYNLEHEHSVMMHPEALMGYHLRYHNIPVNEIEAHFEINAHQYQIDKFNQPTDSDRHSSKYSQHELVYEESDWSLRIRPYYKKDVDIEKFW